MNYPITSHKTAVLVTFSGKCNKNLSQKVILWQTLWQNLLKAKKSNHNREITNIVVFNFEESRIQLVWDFYLKLQVRYNLLNIRLFISRCKILLTFQGLPEGFNGVWLSVSYAINLSQLWQDRRFLWQSLWQNQTQSRRVYIEETKNTRVKEKKGMFSAPLRLVKIM